MFFLLSEGIDRRFRQTNKKPHDFVRPRMVGELLSWDMLIRKF